MKLLPTRVLALLCLLAAAGLAYLWLDKNGSLRNMQWVAPAPIKSSVVATKIVERTMTASDVVELANALERPIFTPDRKPPSAAPILAVAPPPPPDPMASITVVGLITGESGGAMVRADGKVRFISLNQSFGDWTLSSIDERNASFARAGETRVIKMVYAPLNSTATDAGSKVDRLSAATPRNVSPSAPVPEGARLQSEDDLARQRFMDSVRSGANSKKP